MFSVGLFSSCLFGVGLFSSCLFGVGLASVGLFGVGLFGVGLACIGLLGPPGRSLPLGAASWPATWSSGRRVDPERRGDLGQPVCDLAHDLKKLGLGLVRNVREHDVGPNRRVRHCLEHHGDAVLRGSAAKRRVGLGRELLSDLGRERCTGLGRARAQPQCTHNATFGQRQPQLVMPFALAVFEPIAEPVSNSIC